MSVVIIATIRPLPEHREFVRRTLLRSVPQVHAEPGCEFYALHDTGTDFVFVEQWSSPDTLAAHSVSPTVKRVQSEMDGRLQVSATLVTATALPAGDTRKGALATPS